ncbi:hypothetical protein [Limnohabitans sp. Bal53]|uniref:hypothetical protein n=1 Tax=Limnohabitans sp. Bal53 TaxID=1977910 RepID=UPI000D3B738C|nr:hypothetical protein [Limnohabitans sp. Bal53]PUE42344.1 hypothetical protein B9Z50_00250 [Limnohabitans sp. Bal53]
MKKMMQLSLIINILVLTPVCLSLWLNAPWVPNGWGEFSPARGILLSIYTAILVVSLGLLWRQEPMAIASLLLVQVIYKITTPLTVGSLENPVVISNLLVAAVHVSTLRLIVRKLRKSH